MKINECMNKDVCFVKSNCNIYDAARIMNENHIGCIPICNDEKNIVGLVTDRDIVLRAVACNKNPKETKISDIMTTNIYTCKSEQDVLEAQNLMSKNQIRRIPIVDNSNKMVGIITTGDLVKYDNNGLEFSSTMGNICESRGSIKNCC